MSLGHYRGFKNLIISIHIYFVFIKARWIDESIINAVTSESYPSLLLEDERFVINLSSLQYICFFYKYFLFKFNMYFRFSPLLKRGLYKLSSSLELDLKIVHNFVPTFLFH